MGVSSDGILVFGFPIGEEDEKPEFLGEHEDLDDYIRAKAGIPEGPPWDWDVRKAAEAACPADMTLYCSYEYPMHILAVRGTEVKVHRGYSEEIKPESLIVAPERIAAFKAKCEDVGIEYQEPKWLLCSMYG